MISGRKPGRPAPERIDILGFLDVLWGDGCRLPGGSGAVRGILRDISLTDRTVLDLGCGSGGTTCSLLTDHGAHRVTGVESDADAVTRARRRIWSRGLAGRVDFVEGAPCPLALPDRAFDVVFAHGPLPQPADRTLLFAELARVLRPGGWLLVGDWLLAREQPASAELDRWLELAGRHEDRATPEHCRAALEAAGFADIDLQDQSAWYGEITRDELRLLEGPLGQQAATVTGPEALEHASATWHALIAVLSSGELRPHHLRARRA